MSYVEEIEFPTVKTIMKKDDRYAYRFNNMVVIQSSAVEDDGHVWIHTSFSRKSRLPDYNDMKRVKEIFIGDDRKAIMIFPEKDNHVNLHEYCLHFFTPVDNYPLPDFTHGFGTI